MWNDVKAAGNGIYSQLKRHGYANLILAIAIAIQLYRASYNYM